MSGRRLWAIARKEMIQLRRDARSLYLAFILPVLLLIVFGYAITFDIRDIAFAVLDHSRSAESRALVDAFQSSGYFTLVRDLVDDGEAEDLLGRGEARLVFVIPPDFAAALSSGRSAQVQVLLDGADANTAIIAQNYAEAIAAGFRTGVRIGTAGGAPAVETRSRIWYNETLESRNMIVPGLVAVIMTILAAMLTALTIAREWERGTMEQLAATPVHRLEVVLGKLLPYVAIGLFDVTLTIGLGWAIFGVPVRGNLVLLGGLTLLFLLGALGLGIFISAAVKSTVLATQGALIGTFLPALLLSGFVFSIPAMPVVLRAASYAVPARYYVTVTRGILLKGVGADVLWTEGLAMIVFGVVGLALAIGVFRKEIA